MSYSCCRCVSNVRVLGKLISFCNSVIRLQAGPRVVSIGYWHQNMGNASYFQSPQRPCNTGLMYVVVWFTTTAMCCLVCT
jgi:hypothetical protein